MWRDAIELGLDDERRRHAGEQLDWIAREPANPRPYYHLAQLERIAFHEDRALALLLEAVRLDPLFAPAHVSLVEMYAVRHDYAAAWRHARAAETSGDRSGVELLARHGVAEIG
jgi:hypothetical protein